MRCKKILTMALFAMALISGSTAAQSQGWVPLGCRDVDMRIDRDVVRVERRDIKFTAIRLHVIGSDVRFFDLKVVYGNGEPDDVPVRAVIAAGRQSGALDLRGRDRFLDRIEMVYASQPSFRGKARVCVEGREAFAAAPAGPGAGEWIQLGCASVNMRVDRDVIRVERRDVKFTAIRLRVIGSDVRFFDLKVVYGNGEPDDVPVRAVIAAGRQSGALDLRGRDRFLDRIELVYAAQPSFRGQARVCADGRTS